MQRLTGKVALVTGSSRGIGKAVALKLAQEGAIVVINYNAHREQADDVVQTIKQMGTDALALQGDMSDVSQIERVVAQAVETYGRLDILVSNAGVEFFKDLEDTTPEDFDRVFATNTRGQFFVIQQAAKRMQSGGRIVCTASISAMKPFVGHALYSASKAAVITIAQNLAIELGPRGITINAVAPGGTQTDMASETAQKYAIPGLNMSMEAMVKSMVSLGRLGTVEEIADVIVFLVTDEARWITGQVIVVDGGTH
jgi:NAD(P)-dependent dehydrogenase (short-subunit alcohol dehydrogenase family)